ncbi:MAG: hypothetical protein Q9224_000904 [Gallowayella concinna]
MLEPECKLIATAELELNRRMKLGPGLAGLSEKKKKRSEIWGYPRRLGFAEKKKRYCGPVQQHAHAFTNSQVL